MTIEAELARLSPTLARAVELFRLAEVAEAAIADWQARMPLLGDVIDSTFMLLRPTAPLQGKGARLYRMHCDELIDRVIRGEDTRPGTDAELMAALADISMVEPLLHDTAVTYCRLYQGRFGALPTLDGIAPEYDTFALYETWEGAADVIEQEMRRKLASPDRLCMGS